MVKSIQWIFAAATIMLVTGYASWEKAAAQSPRTSWYEPSREVPSTRLSVVVVV